MTVTTPDSSGDQVDPAARPEQPPVGDVESTAPAPANLYGAIGGAARGGRVRFKSA